MLLSMVRKVAKKINPIADPSRRRHLRGAAVWAVAAVVPLTAMRALAASKAAKSDVQYQETPKDGQKCDQCIHYQPSAGKEGVGECAVVAGEVKAEGYCIAFSGKS